MEFGENWPMPKKPTKRRQPGWFVAEWLAYTEKKQVDLVEATGWSKGRVSDLINGKERYNEDILRQFAAVIGCTPGELIDVNPIEGRPLWSTWKKIPPEKQGFAIEVLEGLSKKAG